MPGEFQCQEGRQVGRQDLSLHMGQRGHSASSITLPRLALGTSCSVSFSATPYLSFWSFTEPRTRARDPLLSSAGVIDTTLPVFLCRCWKFELKCSCLLVIHLPSTPRGYYLFPLISNLLSPHIGRMICLLPLITPTSTIQVPNRLL